ncbi:hypothetical protein NL676_027652 [Syzygium grande]|nr:hypothetical protein NL676_027652 [Syzygium grande]
MEGTGVSSCEFNERSLCKLKSLLCSLPAQHIKSLSNLQEESVMVHSFSLRDFLLRARVLKLYRQALRIARRAPDHAQAELRQTIRREIEKNRYCDDKQRIRFLLSEGLERVKDLDEMLDMQGH